MLHLHLGSDFSKPSGWQWAKWDATSAGPLKHLSATLVESIFQNKKYEINENPKSWSSSGFPLTSVLRTFLKALTQWPGTLSRTTVLSRACKAFRYDLEIWMAIQLSKTSANSAKASACRFAISGASRRRWEAKAWKHRVVQPFGPTSNSSMASSPPLRTATGRKDVWHSPAHHPELWGRFSWVAFAEGTSNYLHDHVKVFDVI